MIDECKQNAYAIASGFLLALNVCEPRLSHQTSNTEMTFEAAACT